MSESIADAARVLVAVVTRPHDLELARTQRWYRIPLRRAPRALAAEYLAFYPTAACGAARWAIHELAAIESVSIATRAELLPDEPAHPRAAERYYRFALGPLQRLPTPLPSRRLRRVCFIPTTYGQLLRARDLAELWQPAGAGAGWDALWGAGIARPR